MVQRIRGYVSVAYSHVMTLMCIIGWECMVISLLIGAIFGFIVGYKLGLDDFFGHLPPPSPPLVPA